MDIIEKVGGLSGPPAHGRGRPCGKAAAGRGPEDGFFARRTSALSQAPAACESGRMVEFCCFFCYLLTLLFPFGLAGNHRKRPGEAGSIGGSVEIWQKIVVNLPLTALSKNVTIQLQFVILERK